MKDIVYSTASELARAIQAKELSSEDAVDAHLKRIAEVNPKLNAVVWQEDGYLTRQAARAADTELMRGQVRGPLHGVPITIKDAFEAKGQVSTGGTKGRAKFVATKDATIVARLKAAGAIILGRTNTPEGSFSVECANLVYGQTNNPWDVNRTPGGSSGGEASIIAAGGSPLGIGSDAGGSIRWPAHCTGIAGMKPTTGRVPRTGHWPAFGGLFAHITQPGPMARSVEDVALCLNIISGMDWVDPTTVPMPLRDYKQVKLKSLRVAFHTDNGIMAADPEVADVVRDAAKRLEEVTKSVEEARPTGIEMATELHMALTGADGGAGIEAVLREAGTMEFAPGLAKRLELAKKGRPATSAELLQTMVKWEDYRSKLLSFMDKHDVIVCPPNVHVASLHNHGSDRFPGAFSYTHAFNHSGWPGIVIPARISSKEGMPIGVQVVARPWREDLALAVAAYLEQAYGRFPHPKI